MSDVVVIVLSIISSGTASALITHYSNRPVNHGKGAMMLAQAEKLSSEVDEITARVYAEVVESLKVELSRTRTRSDELEKKVQFLEERVDSISEKYKRLDEWFLIEVLPWLENQHEEVRSSFPLPPDLGTGRRHL